MAHDVNELPMFVSLGHKGENDATVIEFDLSDWLTDYPAGVIALYARRSTETTAYTVTGFAVTEDTDIYAWTVDDVDTGIAGEGIAQLTLTEDDVVKKSVTFKTRVEDGLTDSGGVLTAIPTITTRGDLLTRDASTYTRLPVGTSGQVLCSDGTDPLWVTLGDYLAPSADLVSIEDEGEKYDSTDVEGALVEIASSIESLSSADGISVEDADELFTETTKNVETILAEIGTSLAAKTASAFFLAAHPIGSIYITIDSTNPGSLAGCGGTWTAFATGRVLVGVNPDNADMDAAEEANSIDAATHVHALTNAYAMLATGGGANMKTSGLSWTSNKKLSGSITVNDSDSSSVSTGMNLTGSTDATSTYPPYIAVYMWKRTA